MVYYIRIYLTDDVKICHVFSVWRFYYLDLCLDNTSLTSVKLAGQQIGEFEHFDLLAKNKTLPLLFTF